MSEPTGTFAGHSRLAIVEEALYRRWPENRIAPDLTRIEAACAYLGDPQLTYPVIHVAGTNGKTSVARMIDSLLRAFGLQIGLYTSPHLHSMRERIGIGGEPISADAFVATYEEVAAALTLVDTASTAEGGPELSFFEALTALAFAAFSNAPVDVAIVEVGLGGRWDATNVVKPAVTVITSIGLDHQEYLGDTLAEIAGEKAGIITAPADVVVAAQEDEALAVIAEEVRTVGVRAALAGKDFSVARRAPAVGGQLISIDGIAGRYDDIVLPLYGPHQAENAAVALAAVECFFGALEMPLDIEAIREGFATVTSPGRAEVVRGAPTVLIDVAHNPHGARALVRTITEDFAFTYLVGVVSILAGKDAAGVLAELESVLAEIVVTTNSSRRAMLTSDLAEEAIAVFGADRVSTAVDIAGALELAVSLADAAGSAHMGGAGVVVTGSVVTVADARALLGPPRS